MIDYLRHLLHNGFETLPVTVRNAVAGAARDLYPGELMDDLRKAYDMGLIEQFFISFKTIEKCTALTMESVLEESRLDSHLSLISDAMEEMEWWACFNPSGYPGPTLSSSSGGDKDEPPSLIPPLPPVRGYTAGNDYCPCGSGRKYKKCCGMQAGH
jgi:hypothetical protein